MNWAPLTFEPILKRLIWGGRRLGDVLGKPIGEESDYAESWEIADHRQGTSLVATGPHAGQSLRHLIESDPQSLLGPRLANQDQFPLLIKFIDANDVLSVQVHPDDALGRRLANDNGKTEAWVVLQVEPGSRLYAGLKPGVDRAAMEAALANGTVETLLHQFEPQPGDCVFIPAGTVHAIGAGVLLAEVQQMSDTTFRVHDWNRVGPDGNPRALHLAEALECIDFKVGPVAPVQPRVELLDVSAGRLERLVDCPQFRLDRVILPPGESIRFGDADRFRVLIGVKGQAEVEHAGRSHAIGFGRTMLLPAAAQPCLIQSGDASATLLTCTVP